MKNKLIKLEPIKETTEDYEAIEKALKLLFKREIYLPIVRLLQGQAVSKRVFRNALPSLLEAIRLGRITFNRGTFSGKLSSKISKELRSIGATFDRSEGTYKIGARELPEEVRNAISASQYKFQEKINQIDRKLADIVPEELAAKVELSSHFSDALWKVESKFQKSVRGITVAPQLTVERRKRLASEWSENMQLYIKDFAEKEIKELRAKMQETVFSGNRYGSAISEIQKSYGVSANKAKFLARQETSLLMTKFKQVRYEDAGVKEYIWRCVNRPHQAKGAKYKPGDVRYHHAEHDGKIFRWDSPPITDAEGNRKNPGQDYNCRCFARPVIQK